MKAVLFILLAASSCAVRGQEVPKSNPAQDMRSYSPISFYAISSGNRDLIGALVMVDGVAVLPPDEPDACNLFANRDDWKNFRVANAVPLVVPRDLLRRLSTGDNRIFGSEATVYGRVTTRRVRDLDCLAIEVFSVEPLPKRPRGETDGPVAGNGP